MKNNMYLLHTLLAVVLGIAALVAVVIRAFAPIIIIPALDIPAVVLVSLAALLLDHYLAPQAERCWICIPVLSAVTFGLLSWAGCFVGAAEAVKIGLVGGVVFTVTAWLFTSIQDRLSSGPVCKAAPALSALGLYLASQSFMGMIL